MLDRDGSGQSHSILSGSQWNISQFYSGHHNMLSGLRNRRNSHARISGVSYLSFSDGEDDERSVKEVG